MVVRGPRRDQLFFLIFGRLVLVAGTSGFVYSTAETCHAGRDGAAHREGPGDAVGLGLFVSHEQRPLPARGRLRAHLFLHAERYPEGGARGGRQHSHRLVRHALPSLFAPVRALPD